MGKYLDRFKSSAISNDKQTSDLLEHNAQDHYNILFQKNAKEISEFYSAEIHDYMKRTVPIIEMEINLVEKKLDLLWGQAQLYEFKAELVRFRDLHKKAANIYWELDVCQNSQFSQGNIFDE